MKHLLLIAAAALFSTATQAEMSKSEVNELLALLINSNGHLCASVQNVRPLPVRANLYEVTCLQYRGGSGTKVYHADMTKGVVWEP